MSPPLTRLSLTAETTTADDPPILLIPSSPHLQPPRCLTPYPHQVRFPLPRSPSLSTSPNIVLSENLMLQGNDAHERSIDVRRRDSSRQSISSSPRTARPSQVIQPIKSPSASQQFLIPPSLRMSQLGSPQHDTYSALPSSPASQTIVLQDGSSTLPVQSRATLPVQAKRKPAPILVPMASNMHRSNAADGDERLISTASGSRTISPRTTISNGPRARDQMSHVRISLAQPLPIVQVTEMPESNDTATALPLTSKRVGKIRSESPFLEHRTARQGDIISRDSATARRKSDNEVVDVDVEVPMLGADKSPGWAEFDRLLREPSPEAYYRTC
ncbi:hypothetical protein CI109_100648 [Kwoniella shandongensis]|uniref:Uncharacterized protein n=1 Tax=Kwoniella shandongensis TaxID=1734106 RepID=A0A5M6C2Q0_9TREE|nr:uncharacterized protein CI109_003430 [Kwoniella shandongensis]KAA5528142.1 hypothetical protein CI109_003430 [Kwoniella shandongensis]